MPSGGCTGERGEGPGRGRARGSEEDSHSHLGLDGQMDGRYPWMGVPPICPVFSLLFRPSPLPGPVSSIISFIFLCPTPPQTLSFLPWDCISPSLWVSDPLPHFWFPFIYLHSAFFLQISAPSLGLCPRLSKSLLPSLWVSDPFLLGVCPPRSGFLIPHPGCLHLPVSSQFPSLRV